MLCLSLFGAGSLAGLRVQSINLYLGKVIPFASKDRTELLVGDA